jgi:hypothetical protein
VYKSLDEFEADIDTMCENAKHYNMPNSEVYRDAVKIKVTWLR